MNWQKQVIPRSPLPTLVYGARLPQAQVRLQRSISLGRDFPVVYCEETALNLSTFDRPISWNHHVTFGPPFLVPNVTLFDMPATLSKVCPATFSKKMSIQPDSEFRWPNAPKKRGGFLNLRTCEKGRYGHYTAHLLDPALETSFIAVGNPGLQLLVVYGFNRNDFPWVGNWEESYSIAFMCRGMVANSVEGLSSVPLLFSFHDGRRLHRESGSMKPRTPGCQQRASLKGDT